MRELYHPRRAGRNEALLPWNLAALFELEETIAA
jgi:hypothetical protein